MYAKLKSDGTIQNAPNPLRIVVANPTPEAYEQWGYHKVVENDPPEYDAMTQQVESHYEMQGNDIVILSNGTPTRTFCYIADSVCGYFKILLHGSYDYFNIGIEKPEITIAQLAEIYQKAGSEIFGYKGQVRYATSDDKQYLTNNPQRRCPDISKARRVLGYNPTIPVEEGVARFLQFLKESPESEYKW